MMVLTCGFGSAAEDTVWLNTASTHPMQYYLSLPRGWTAAKSWPVVIVIESANRQFEAAAKRFALARGEMPFVIAVPLVLTNGGPGYRNVPAYHYSDLVWADIERVGRCKFDFDGIAAVARDIRKSYGGEEKFYLTGWEAGGHTVWAFLFQHPETLRAVAPVSTNYAGRCLEDGQFSPAPEKAALPVRIFAGADDGWKSGQFLFEQSHAARKSAEEHGFSKVSEAVVPGKAHEPLAGEVLAYFYSLWKSASN